MAERLFRAYFADGANIADPDTLDRLAAELDVPPGAGGVAQLHVELDRVRALGVESVPVFRLSNGVVVTGEQPEQTFVAALRE